MSEKWRRYRRMGCLSRGFYKRWRRWRKTECKAKAEISYRRLLRTRRQERFTGWRPEGLTADSIGEFLFVEVDEEAKGDVEELHVAEELGFVDREHLFD
jgi:hypothetical protein